MNTVGADALFRPASKAHQFTLVKFASPEEGVWAYMVSQLYIPHSRRSPASIGGK